MSPTPGFPGGSFGRDGGRGGGGGGVLLPLQGPEGVAGRAGDDAPGTQTGVSSGCRARLRSTGVTTPHQSRTALFLH